MSSYNNKISYTEIFESVKRGQLEIIKSIDSQVLYSLENNHKNESLLDCAVRHRQHKVAEYLKSIKLTPTTIQNQEVQSITEISTAENSFMALNQSIHPSGDIDVFNDSEGI